MNENTDQLEALITLNKQSKKQIRRMGVALCIVIILLLLFVGVTGYSMWQLNNTVSTAVKDLPELITTTQQNVTSTSAELSTALEQINAIDYKGLNESIETINKGLGSVDFDALGESIEDLQQTTQRLAAVLSFFG